MPPGRAALTEPPPADGRAGEAGGGGDWAREGGRGAGRAGAALLHQGVAVGAAAPAGTAGTRHRQREFAADGGDGLVCGGRGGQPPPG